MTENRRIFLNVLATYGRSLYGLVLGLLCGRWALMALGEVDYGLNGLVGGLIVFIAFFNNVLAGANARFYAISIGAAKASDNKAAALEECRAWFNTAISVHAVVPIVLIAIGYPIGVHAISHGLTIPPERISACIWVFRFVCLSCFVGMVNVPFTAMYNAKQYIAELTIYSFITSTLNVIVLGYMVSHPSVWLTKYAAWTCALSITPQLIICWRACKIFPECVIKLSYLWNFARIRKLAWYSGWQMLGVFCGMLRAQGMTIVVNKFFGAAMNAAQAIGNTVQGQCNTLAGAMQSAFVPVITQACGAGDYAKMNRFVLRTCKFNVVLSLIFMIPLALELPYVMELWLKTPPAYTVGLCYCAMLFYLVDCCTVGYSVAINAVGKIAKYQIVVNAVSVLTLPLAIIFGFVYRNVYIVMCAQIGVASGVSIVRLLFARHICGTSIREWVFDLVIPICFACLATGAFAILPRFFCEPSFVRLLLTSGVAEVIMLPLVWKFVFSKEERAFVRERLLAKFVKRFK